MYWLDGQVVGKSHGERGSQAIARLLPSIAAARRSGPSTTVDTHANGMNARDRSSTTFSRIPASTTVLVYEGLSRDPEDPSQEIVPVCSRGRALELVLLESGIAYSRHLVDGIDPENSMPDVYKSVSVSYTHLTLPTICSV